MERLFLPDEVLLTKTLENGTLVTAQKIIPFRPTPSSVAEHEAAHIVVAGEIDHATIIPSGNALGTTKPKRMTAAAAAAAEALGHDGTSWDMYLVEHVLGADPTQAKMEASMTLATREEERQEIATLLEERRTIGQSDVLEARENVRRRRGGIYPVEITVTPFKGRSRRFVRESHYDQVDLSSDELQDAA